MNSKPLKILHVTPSVGQGSTGVGAVALDLTRSQNDLGIESQIWCLGSNSDVQWASGLSGVRADRIRGFARTGLHILGLSLEMEKAAASIENHDVAVVHQHGMWSGVSRVTNFLRKAHGASTIIAPHGCLAQSALIRSRWKKKLALALYERSNLHGASCLHVVSESEMRACRDFGLFNPVAVIPNGVSPSWLSSRGDVGRFRRKFDIPADTRVLLFLSRVSPKKGLLMLLEAVHEIGNDFAGWQLVIAGADEFGHQAELERFVLKKGLAKFVKLVGPLFDQVKRDAFASANLFVLPSFSEGAPIVILEALGAEVPVLATKASPWQDLETHGCGWWVDISTVAIAEALRDAVGRSPEQLKLMGQQGKKLVATKYTWARSAQMTIELYEWLLGLKKRPEFVVTD